MECPYCENGIQTLIISGEKKKCIACKGSGVLRPPLVDVIISSNKKGC